MIIAVDGPAAAGKGTVARAVARHFGYHFLDTGSLYRMVGLAVLRGGGDPNDRAAAVRAAQTLRPETYRDEDLRGEDVGKAASIVAVIAEVRAALLDFQREFARKPPGAVLDGRDIGTVVCPDADVKLYITASPQVRARRRMMELAERGTTVPHETVLAEIRARDERDRSRAAAPLVAAADAIVIDTSAMGIEEAVAAAIAAALNRHHANPGKG
jgi:cytidylate kinase